MTEASENAYLVRVRAQVMCRDEGTGGWVALGGGGLADVMVGRRPAMHTHRISAGSGDSNGDTTSTSAIVPTPAHEYYIHGKRISDNMVVLECTVKKDFQYNKVMPTFHHWVTDEKRFGLTFQTAADARAFDKGVRTAIEELLDGLGGAWPSLHAYKKHNPAPKEDDEEQNIFECLNLPSGRDDGNLRRDLQTLQTLQTPILAPINLTTHQPHPAHPLNGHEPMKQYEEKPSTEDETERCHYVQLSAVHEYTYPQVGQGVISSEKSTPNTKPPLLKRDSGSLKKSSYSAPPPLPGKKAIETFQGRIKCRHCHEWYLESANRAGSCEYAPDCCRTCVDCVSCIKCAQCLVYHCGWDSEGDAVNRPCACAPPHTTCAVRWVAIVALSLVVPCLCCYVPLRCAHRAARAAHIAGEPHAPHVQHVHHAQHAQHAPHTQHAPHREHD